MNTRRIIKNTGWIWSPRHLEKKQSPRKAALQQRTKRVCCFLPLWQGIGLIITTAFAASIKYETNQIIQQNHELEAEIENLNVAVYSESNIEALEEKAMDKQGMVYPSSKQVVYLTEGEQPKDGFADIMRKQAYNWSCKSII